MHSLDARLVVAAAVIVREDCYLVTRRQRGVHLEGFFEFPGGKCDAGESLPQCLARELREELNVDAVVGREIHVTTHRYDDRSVELHFIECELAGDPQPQLGQEVRWVPRSELPALPFPPADAELIRILTLAPSLRWSAVTMAKAEGPHYEISLARLRVRAIRRGPTAVPGSSCASDRRDSADFSRRRPSRPDPSAPD